jgi:Fe2+ transport system protein FeoA
MVTQMQKDEKYIVVKVMKISDGSAQRALREFGPNPGCSIDV